MTILFSDLGFGLLSEREQAIAKRAALLMNSQMMEFARKAVEERHRTSYRQGWDDGFKIGAVDSRDPGKV